jgi:hypothetical protein
VSIKRIERFIKSISENNFSSISSVSDNKFSKMIYYFYNHPIYLKNEKIYEEIIYRIENNLLIEKDL